MTTTETALSGKVRDLITREIGAGQQIGTQVAAYHRGEMIVDAWAGTMGPDDSRPAEADSLFFSFSTTKGVAATALHILADRGVIEYEQPVAKYWPEFAAQGKAKVTVAQAMSHQAGLHTTPPMEITLDWEAALDYVANLAPAWEPGTATGYHATTFGWIVGGIIRGATGYHLKEVIAEEIAAPLGVATEMYVGIPDGIEERLTTLKPTPPPPPGAPNLRALLPADHDFFKAMPMDDPIDMNAMNVRKACVPAWNGHFTARALAKMYAALANGGQVAGTRLVSPERIGKMSAIQTELGDRVLTFPIPKSIGYWNGGSWAMGGNPSFLGPRRTAFGHPGMGGSMAFADPEVGLSIAVTLNQMGPGLFGDGPGFRICNLIRDELGLN